MESSITLLLSKLNSSSAKEMKVSFSRALNFSYRFKSLALSLMSSPYTFIFIVIQRPNSSISQLWPELFLFLLDYTLLHPSCIQESSEIILYFYHQLSDSSTSCHHEWLLEYCMMAISILHSVASSHGTFSIHILS